MNLSENLKKIRKENSLSQEQLAEKLNVSRQSVSKWESAQAYPEMDKVLQICQLFNVSVDDLLTQDLKELNNNKIAKSNINRFIDDFLNYLTKIIDMFSNLKFKEKVKCIFEQFILIIIFYVIGVLVLSLGYSFVSHILSFLPNNVYIFTFNLLKDISILCLSILFTALLFHIFKIRYLNYYVIDDDKLLLGDETVINKNEDISNKNDSNVIKKEKIIIRDPKHTAYNFISSIIKCFIFFIKILMILVGLFVCAFFVFFVSLLVVSFSIIKAGLLFIGLLLSLLGITLLLGQVIVTIFNFVTNRKNVLKRMCIIFISSLISIGIGIGLIALAIPKFNYFEFYSNKYVTTSQEFDIDNNTVIASYCEFNYSLDAINYIEEDRDNLLIEVNHSKYQEIDFNKLNNYIYVYNDVKTLNFNFIRDIIKDINDYKIVDINNLSKYNVSIHGNKDNLELIKNNSNDYCKTLEYYN